MLKIGKIPFTNLFPYYHYLERYCGGDYQFIEDVPSRINTLIREGEIDISPSSSIEFLRDPDRYELIPGHSVSSFGAVRSILLFSKQDIETLDGMAVLCTYKSETSVALLRIILTVFYSLDCELKGSELSLEEALRDYPAYLLIGDDALRESSRHSGLKMYDLGEIWYRETGLPFVFALWIARKDLGRTSARELESFIQDLYEARRWAFNNLGHLAELCPLREELSNERLIEYWQGLSYDFDEEHKKGLALFRQYLVELKII